MARAPRTIPQLPGATVGLMWNETTREKLMALGKLEPTDAEVASYFKVSLNTWAQLQKPISGSW